MVLSENSGIGSTDAALVSAELSSSVPGNSSVEPRALCQTSSSGLSTEEMEDSRVRNSEWQGIFLGRLGSIMPTSSVRLFDDLLSIIFSGEVV